MCILCMDCMTSIIFSLIAMYITLSPLYLSQVHCHQNSGLGASMSEPTESNAHETDPVVAKTVQVCL